MPSCMCSFLISTRSSVRSLASRLDSGSSKRNTSTSRTSARPIATRWRWPPESSDGPAFEERPDLQELGGLLDAPRDLVSRHARDLQAEGQVPLRRHARVERVGLEHHADAAILRLLPGDVLAADPDLPGVDVEQAGDGVEQRRLAAARRPEEHDELALLDIEVEVFEDLADGRRRRRACGPIRSPSAQPFTAPAAMPRTNQLPRDEIDGERHQRRSGSSPPC